MRRGPVFGEPSGAEAGVRVDRLQQVGNAAEGTLGPSLRYDASQTRAADGNVRCGRPRTAAVRILR